MLLLQRHPFKCDYVLKIERFKVNKKVQRFKVIIYGSYVERFKVNKKVKGSKLRMLPYEKSFKVTHAGRHWIGEKGGGQY